ncbi:basic proline-rich protein-like [Vidua chalybeata]|uniref:basic proline-rich protein-like n=1 Tax=Vidua chalybeata TaxID=81927 RepID=UPI0023A802C3|nr:basic proline-rich protein-like [Vidua chalybeata]
MAGAVFPRGHSKEAAVRAFEPLRSLSLLPTSQHAPPPPPAAEEGQAERQAGEDALPGARGRRALARQRQERASPATRRKGRVLGVPMGKSKPPGLLREETGQEDRVLRWGKPSWAGEPPRRGHLVSGTQAVPDRSPDGSRTCGEVRLKGSGRRAASSPAVRDSAPPPGARSCAGQGAGCRTLLPRTPAGAPFGLPDQPGHCACSDGVETHSAHLHLSAAPKSGPPGTGLKAPVPPGWGGGPRAHPEVALLPLAGRWAQAQSPLRSPGGEGSLGGRASRTGCGRASPRSLRHHPGPRGTGSDRPGTAKVWVPEPRPAPSVPRLHGHISLGSLPPPHEGRMSAPPWYETPERHKPRPAPPRDSRAPTPPCCPRLPARYRQKFDDAS